MRHQAFLIAIAIALSACGSDKEPLAGHESHWLPCNTDADCEEGFVCERLGPDVDLRCVPVEDVSNGTNNTNSANATNNGTSNATNNGTSNATNNGTSNNVPVNNGLASCPKRSGATYDGELVETVGTWYLGGHCTTAPMPDVQSICGGAAEISNREQEWYYEGVASVDSEYRYVVNSVYAGEVDIRFPEACLDELGGDCAAAEGVVDDLLRSENAEGSVTCVVDAGDCLCTFDGDLRSLASGVFTSEARGNATSHSFGAGGEIVTHDWIIAGGDLPLFYRVDSDESFDLYGLVEENYNGALYCAAFMTTCNDVEGVTGYANYRDCFTQASTLNRTGTPQTTGDSFECRFHHMMLAADAREVSNRETYCPTAQFVASGPCVD